MFNETVKFIDLFAGMGGMRLGFEQACHDAKLNPVCVYTSEIKSHAIAVYQDNFPGSEMDGDITEVDADKIPDFDVLLGGFPCQPFSQAGNGGGFMDTRGTMFFEIERILKAKRPKAFILENVEGLIRHQREDKSKPIGRTMEIILDSLRSLGYCVTWKLLDSQFFGVPQQRKRVYFVGTLEKEVSLDHFPVTKLKIGDILEKGLPTLNTDFANSLTANYSIDELRGRVVNDKRGGDNNIHSWDIEMKGPTTRTQREIMTKLITERRRKKWAEDKGIMWVDGMPLTAKEVSQFIELPEDEIKELCDDLVKKGYLVYKHPNIKRTVSDEHGNKMTVNDEGVHLEKGYTPYTGRLSFPVNRILDPKGVSVAIVATDARRLAVTDGDGVRHLTVKEGLRMFGYPHDFKLDNISENKAFDLLGNTVVVNVIRALSSRLLHTGGIDAIR